MPFFSVIIPVYNREDELRRALDSVLAQDCADYEIIIIDDGSAPAMGPAAKGYGSAVKYIWQPNRGVSAARNRGILSSSSPFIAFLDSDDCWQPGKLRAHRDFIKNNPDMAMHQCEEAWVRSGTRINPPASYTKSDGDLFIPSLGRYLFSPSCAILSRGLLEKYGLFDEEMPVCEDYDLWLRLTAFEKAGLIREKLVTRYSGHGGQLSMKYRAMDRFRAYSILKLLETSGDELSPEKRDAAAKSAVKKLSILRSGAAKRKNREMEYAAEKILGLLRDGCCSRKDYRSLLQIEDSP